MKASEIRSRVADLMPELLADLERLVAIPSVAFPGYPPEPVAQMADEALRLFREAGVANAELQQVPAGYPPVYGEIPGPDGAPTVMLYAHYDVQPAPPEQGWTSDPWTATRKPDGRIYGRGAADDKGGLVIHLGTLRVFDGMPPCTVRLILEGMEETDSNLEAFVEAHPGRFACDLFVVCDMGNLRVGEPTLTTTLRGEVVCLVTLRTLAHPLHSGEFGGAAPDAMLALARLLATLHDDQGNVAVEGVSSFAWDGADLSAEEFRAGADLLKGVHLTGSGPVGARLWSRPSISAIGVDTTSVAGSSNVLIPQARAKLSMRIVPGSDPQRERDALVRHLESHAPGARRCRSTGSTRRLGSAAGRAVPPTPPPGAPWRRPTGGRPGRPAAAARSRCWRPCRRSRRRPSSSCGAPRTARPRGSTPRMRAWTPPRSSGWSSPKPSCCRNWRTGGSHERVCQPAPQR
jgi:acetylornithine deacetylase/succinyl-diaminopimelate desuccinylase-like protein